MSSPRTTWSAVAPRLLAALIVGLAAATLFSGAGGDGAPAEPGGCAHVVGDETSASFATVDCAADEATHRVGAIVDAAGACPTPNYVVYTESTEQRPGFSVCLVPRLVEGACYDERG